MEIIALSIEEKLNLEEFSSFINQQLILKNSNLFDSEEEPPQKIKKTQEIYSFSTQHITDYNKLEDAVEHVQNFFKTYQSLTEISIIMFKVNDEKHLLTLGINNSKNTTTDYLDYLAEKVWNNFKFADNEILLPDEYDQCNKSCIEKLNNIEMQARQAYWKQKLEKVQFERIPRPDYFQRELKNFTERKVINFTINETTKTQIDNLCTEVIVTPSIIYTSLFTVLLNRYSGTREICLLFYGDNDIITGKVIYLKISLTTDVTLKDIILQIRENVWEATNHYLPKSLVENQIRENRHEETILNTISYTCLPNAYVNLNKLNINRKGKRINLSLTFIEDAMKTIGFLEWDNTMFDTVKMNRFLGNFTKLLEEAFESINHSVYTLPILTDEEKNELFKWNNIHYDFKEHICIHQLFEKSAEKFPHRIAIIDQYRHINFEKLNQRAKEFANFLYTQMSCEPEKIIGICMDKSIELVICILAILKTGSAYLILDPNHPQDRIRFLLRASETAVALIQPKYNYLFHDIIPVILIDDLTFTLTNPINFTNVVQEHNLAYVLFTSGTTGIPKGVMTEHRNVVAFIQSMEKIFNSQQEKILLSASYNFCLFHALLFYALCTGNTGILAQTILHVPQLPSKNEITFIANPPAGLDHLIKTRELPTSISTVILGGDKIPSQLIQSIKSLPFGNCIKIYTCHGCTELTLFDTMGNIEETKGEKISIGRPFPGLRIYITDENIQQVPLGVIGELCVSGAQVSRGYIGLLDQQKDKYLINPFDGNSSLKIKCNNYSRLYRTGDLGRWNMDGTIDLIGRIDFQVKIRGIRIELDEISQILLQHSKIEDAVVIVDQINSKSENLLAYYCIKEKNTFVSTEELQQFLSTRLPKYMLPNHFIQLERLPRNVNGKVDRLNLPKPDKQMLVKKYTKVNPQNELQQKLLLLLRKAFSNDTLEMTDNFEQQGLDSITANYLAVVISMEFEINFKVEYLFHNLNAVDLSICIENLTKKSCETFDNFDPDKETSLTEKEIFQIKHSDVNWKTASDPKNVFFTGATGYLGGFLLRELLEKTVVEIYCLVRASNPAEAEEKIKTNMKKYQIWDVTYERRIHCVLGDLHKPQFALDNESYSFLSCLIDVIYHCGSLVNFFLPYSALRSDAVFGTKEIIMFSCNSHLKPIHHISSVAVHEITMNCSETAILETFPKTVKKPLTNMGYVRMKWVSEKLLWNAHQHGLPLKIYRPSFVIGHTKSGAMSTKEFISRLIKGCIQMECYPEWDYCLNMIPVDYIIEAILTISFQSWSFGRAFHLTPDSDKDVTIWELFKWINELGYSLSPMPVMDWIQMLKEKLSQGESNELFPLLQLVSNLSQDKDNKKKQYDATNTKEAFKNSNVCPIVKKSNIESILKYFKNNSFLPI